MSEIDPNAPVTPPNTNPETPPAPEPQVVPREEFERVKADMHKFKTEAQQRATELENARMNSLKEKQDWKTIAEENERKAREASEKYEGLNKSLVENAKQSALQNAAVRAGILPSSLADLELLDFAELHVETTSGGKILVSGADQAIENLKKRRPQWFGSKPASVNPASPEIQVPENGVVTLQRLGELEKAYQADPQNSAKRDAYMSGIKAFKSQNPS